jgi:hypothetical protein
MDMMQNLHSRINKRLILVDEIFSEIKEDEYYLILDRYNMHKAENKALSRSIRSKPSKGDVKW